MLFITLTWQPHRTNSCCSVSVTELNDWWLHICCMLPIAHWIPIFLFMRCSVETSHLLRWYSIWMKVFLYPKLKSLKNHDHIMNIGTSTDVFTGVGFLPPVCMDYSTIVLLWNIAQHFFTLYKFLFFFFFPPPSPRINYPVAELDSTHTILLTQLGLYNLYFHILCEWEVWELVSWSSVLKDISQVSYLYSCH